ncbi:MAG: GMC family oxidoreductase [Rhodospirillales bacterium]|nr:GMC family oxidoreductase [Rhodospirillales bacterium]MDP6643771.1 GMC family oxidoreductase [Rhodospirillales bacterium]
MIRDLRVMEGGGTIDADICIVGSGPAAMSFALQYLNETNKKIVMVESGGLDSETEVQELYEGVSDGIDLPNGLDGSRLRFFGGSSNCWAGACTPLDDIDFEKRAWVPDSGWPIKPSELTPDYRTAQEICNVGPFIYDDRNLGTADRGKKIPFLPSKLETGYWRFSSEPRFGTFYRDSIKNSANITLILHANATGLEVNAAADHVKALKIQSLTGKKAVVRARHFVLACGGIENARILLYSNSVQKNGLGNGKDMVGRYFMDHPVAPIATIIGNKDDERLKFYNLFNDPAPQTNGTKYNLIIKMPAAFQRRHKILNSAAFIVDHEPMFSEGMMAAVRLRQAYRQKRIPEDIAGDLWDILKDLDDVVLNTYNRFFRYGEQRTRLALKIQAEQQPNRDSRVRLSSRLDALGLPQTRLTWKVSELDRRTVDVLVRTIAAELGKLDIARTRLDDWVETASGALFPSDLRGGVHHTGTTRMSAGPETGVVDKNCRVHSVGNLFIAGSSVFATNGWANPTLTICSLAVRLARHIKSIV